MTQWYCGVQGQQYGPLDEQALRGWIAEGRLTANDFVWCEGMAAWRPAGEQFPDMFHAGAAGWRAMPGLVAVFPPGGTGGATPNAELTAQARRLLDGRWGLPIGFCLLAFLISFASGMLPYIGWIPQLILAGPLELGVLVFFLTFNRGGQGDLGMLFVGFKNFGTALGTNLLAALLVFAWMLLGASMGIVVMILAAATEEPALLALGMALMVPGIVLGIVKQLAYSQAMFLIADDSNLGAVEAIRRSMQLMNGFKTKLFCLGWRFFGWALLCLLTLGIGFLWLTPYMNVAFTRFYDDLQPPREAQHVR
ncbi:MAG: DUF975 family protein [Phycisphaerae bacterium]|nr:DUF975 family protein [Phycisphaerae bacterium]